MTLREVDSMATTKKTVKQLAIEKGIFRQRGVKRSSSVNNGGGNSLGISASCTSLPISTASKTTVIDDEERLRFLIVIDFEFAKQGFSHNFFSLNLYLKPFESK